MAQDNTKLCDFTNTNNNDFISTPIAPLTDAESCEINTALLNLAMKEPFLVFPVNTSAEPGNSTGFVRPFSASLVTGTKVWALKAPPLVPVQHEPVLKGNHVARASSGGREPFSTGW